MQLSDRIHKVLKDAHGDLIDLEVEDLIKNTCSYKSFLMLIREDWTKQKSPEELLLMLAHDAFRRLRFASYMKGAFGDDYEPPEDVNPTYEGIVSIRHEGRLYGTPVFLEFRPDHAYDGGQTPKHLRNIVAARSYLLGSPDEAIVVIMDQNTQGWNAWHMLGDFSKVGKLVADEVTYLSRLVSGEAEELGDAKSCRGCQFETTCGVEERSDIKPDFPVVSYKMVNHTGMINSLDKYLESLNDVSTRRKTKVIHPSEITVMRCDRCIAYGLMGIEEKKKITPALFRIFHMGHCFHDAIQDALSYDLGDDFQAEVRILHEDLLIQGSCDGVEPEAAVEIKTISRKGAEKLTGPKTEHEDQATIYARASQVDKDRIKYLYINKNTGDLIEFDKKVSSRRWHKIARRAANIVRSVQEGILPDQIDKKYICAGCKYAWYCRPGETFNSGRRF